MDVLLSLFSRRWWDRFRRPGVGSIVRSLAGGRRTCPELLLKKGKYTNIVGASKADVVAELGQPDVPARSAASADRRSRATRSSRYPATSSRGLAAS